ncbi:MAG: class I SAM-dependent methyltransferase [Candidatus Methylumidiphilus sp.]
MSEISWGESELEHLNRCPICGSQDRELRYANIEDRICETLGKWDYYQCSRCSVLYIDPRPTEATIGRAYENYFTHTVLEERERVGWLDKLALGMRNDYLNWKYGYENKPALTAGRWLMYLLPPWLRLEWDHYARHLPKPGLGKNRLLDVGCGNGDFLVAAQAAGWECYGLDFDEKAIGTARTRGIEVSVGTLAAQRYSDNFFDAITLSHVIEHVHHPVMLLKECAKLLKPSGILWLATPNANSIVNNWFQRYWLSLCAPQHLIIFNPRNLKSLIENFGFSVITKRRGVHVQSHWVASKRLQQGRSGMTDICLSPFIERKSKLRYWPLELLLCVFPSIQGDVVICATKKN